MTDNTSCAVTPCRVAAPRPTGQPLSGGRRTALEERAVRQSGQDGGCLLVAVPVVVVAVVVVIAATVVVVVVVIVVATPHFDLSGEDAAVGL